MSASVSEKEYIKEIQALKEIIQEQSQKLQEQSQKIQLLEEEINRLKNRPKKPKLKPSGIGLLEKLSAKKSLKARKKRRKKLKIHKIITLKPDNLPQGSRLLKYRDYIVQNIRIEAENIKYRRPIYKTPEGVCVFTKLPSEIKGSSYGVELRAYILSLYHSMHVSQRDIVSALQGYGIQISPAQVSRILTQGHDVFHKEKEDILEAGLQSSAHIVVDDTGLRQNGRNGFCTHIGNERFASFQSSLSKSRLNFLLILRGKYKDYCINEYGLKYLKARKFPEEKCLLLKRLIGKTYSDEESYKQALKAFGIREEHHLRLAYEAGLMGSIMKHRPLIPIIVSDAAGQFNVFNHAACWIHAERGLSKLIPNNAIERELLDTALDRYWSFYEELKAYKQKPGASKKAQLEAKFDDILTANADYSELNKALKATHDHKQDLLAVLDYPYIPLHNNISERDIREVAKKRKISAGTRSNAGRDARDDFLSLKKTCQKLGIKFGDYLLDRLYGKYQIPYLPELILQNAARPP